MPGVRQLRADVLAGVTVSLVAVPQCMGFAMIAGLPPYAGLVSAVAMGLVSAAISRSPKLVVGPAITSSTMLLAVLRLVEPERPDHWPVLAGLVAILTGLMTIAAALLDVGKAVRFVSRSVVIGLVTCSAALTVASQMGPALALPSGRHSTLIGMLWHAARNVGEADVRAALVATGVGAAVLAGAWWAPRLPIAFAALCASAVAVWWLGFEAESIAGASGVAWQWPMGSVLAKLPPVETDLLVGAGTIALVGVIQSLTLAQAFSLRDDRRLSPKRELVALGAANVVCGVAGGFPGSASFARSALNDVAGARTRLASVVAALGTGLIAVLAMPLLRYIPASAIAGLLIATAVAMVNWRELRSVAWDRDDRPVVLTMLACVLVLPIHWAILIGLSLSIAFFLRRVARPHLCEMVRRSDGAFREQEIDAETGRSEITMLQFEGPLFFAHADPIAQKLRAVFERGPRVVVVRMRRTHQIDFSVIEAMHTVIGEFVRRGGHVILCGLHRGVRSALRRTSLGRLLGPSNLLSTTREVFGSAHQAIAEAERLLADAPLDARPRFRARD